MKCSIRTCISQVISLNFDHARQSLSILRAKENRYILLMNEYSFLNLKCLCAILNTRFTIIEGSKNPYRS